MNFGLSLGIIVEFCFLNDYYVMVVLTREN